MRYVRSINYCHRIGEEVEISFVTLKSGSVNHHHKIFTEARNNSPIGMEYLKCETSLKLNLSCNIVCKCSWYVAENTDVLCETHISEIFPKISSPSI